MGNKTLVIGHRGAMGEAVENTLFSFEKALKQGADGLEFDVHLSADGHPVVFHDQYLDQKTVKTGLIKDYTMDELKNIKYKNTIDKNNINSGSGVPALEDVLEIAKNADIINIEIKYGFQLYPGIEEAVLERVNNYNLQDKVLISSFNHYSLVKIKKINSHIKCGLLYSAGIYRPWEYAEKLGVEALHPYYESMNEEIISSCKKNNIDINIWGTNDSKIIKNFINAGVSMIICDYPAEVVKLRDDLWFK